MLLMGGVAEAQNTSSPYSIFGIGDIETGSYNRTAGMAGTGLAYRSNSSIIQNNPAAYTALIQQYFQLEASGTGQYSTYVGASFDNNPGASNVSTDIVPTRFTAAAKVNNWWASSIGIMPYSNVSYNFTSNVPLQGPGGLLGSATYAGNGGLHRAYWGNGFALGKHLSLGFDGNFIFGAINEQEALSSTDAGATVNTSRNLYLRNVVADFGAQFYTTLGKNKNWGLSIGAIYFPGQALYASDSLTSNVNGIIPIANTLLDNNTFHLPTSYGAGLLLSKENRMKRYAWVADYKRQEWNQMGYYGTGYALTNSDWYSVGMELTKRTLILNTPVDHLIYQAGAYLNKTYLTLDGYPVYDAGGSIGIGVRPLRYRWGYDLALQYGSKGNGEIGAIREYYFRINITISYSDIWYTRGHRID